MDRPLSIVVITQEDSVAIPANVQRICAMPDVRIDLIAVLDAQGSLENRKSMFVKGFGLWQSARMASKLAWRKAANVLDAACAYRLLKRKYSISAVARHRGVPFTRVNSPNTAEFLARLEALRPDLVVSFSAPCVFGRKLLQIPRLGCINLHCSLLPKYAGVLPSFWTLYHQEREAGATVHFMDTKIDNGDILCQARLPIEPNLSMFQLIQRTKRAGGELMVRAIEAIRRGTADVISNDTLQQTYFSWPTVQQMTEFRQRGGRLA